MVEDSVLPQEAQERLWVPVAVQVAALVTVQPDQLWPLAAMTVPVAMVAPQSEQTVLPV